MRQLIITHGSVVALNLRVLLRLARLAKLKGDATAVCPAHQRSNDVSVIFNLGFLLQVYDFRSAKLV